MKSPLQRELDDAARWKTPVKNGESTLTSVSETLAARGHSDRLILNIWSALSAKTLSAWKDRLSKK